MKIKLYPKIIAFFFSTAFLLAGFLNVQDTLFSVVHYARLFVQAAIAGDGGAFESFKKNINTVSDYPIYHDQLLDLDSIKENLIGTRVVKKNDKTVVKSAFDRLVEPSGKVQTDDMLPCVEQLKQLETIAEQQGARFLFVSIPRKERFVTVPVNIVDASKENYDSYLSLLRERDVPLVDLEEGLMRHGLSGEEMFFYTDHHWKPYPGFVSSLIICEELNMRYGLEYDETYTNIDNYRVETYNDYFLGSYGKKVGTYFTWQGADDFDLILPKFETDMTEEQPFKNKVRTGSFEETVLYMENIQQKNYYLLNTYCVYSGGDFRLQIMKNNLNPEGKKILLIRDSFACVTAPFLSLQTSELHICDMRNFEEFVGEKINVEEYIKEIQPDYVIVQFIGYGSTGDDRYNFF